MDKVEVLNLYRQRDQVEKMFDIFKNEMDGDRLRSHSQYNTDGRLFIKFVALILYAEVSRIMKKEKLFDNYTVKELFSETIKKYSRINAVVNNAGIIRDNLIWKMSMQDFETVLNVNLKGKITHIEKNDPFLSELSKRQKIIFDAFGIQEDSLHSY